MKAVPGYFFEFKEGGIHRSIATTSVFVTVFGPIFFFGPGLAYGPESATLTATPCSAPLPVGETA